MAALSCVALLPGIARADVGATFGSPQLIDGSAPFGDPLVVSAVSCAPSSTHCAALGQIAGGVLQQTTTDLAGSSTTPTWSTPGSAGLAGFTPTNVTCPTATLCVAVGSGETTGGPGQQMNEVTVSSDGGTTWSAPTALEPYTTSDVISAVGCTTIGTCVAVDADGNAFDGDAATAGAWTADPLTPDSSVTFEQPAVACSGSGACVVTALQNGTAALLVSTDVDGGGVPTWSVMPTTDKPGAIADAVACAPAGTTCVAVDTKGKALISTSPGATGWTAVSTGDSHVLQAVSCPSDDECVITDAGARSLIATGVSAAKPSFTKVALPSAALHLSCPSTSWCVGGSGASVTYGQIEGSTPSQTTWSGGQLAGADPLTGLACSESGGLCAASDSRGRVTVSSDSGASWSPPSPLSGLTAPASGVSCTPDGMCVIVSNQKAFVATGIGSAGATFWSTGTTLGKSSRDIVGLSCASESLCVAIDTQGDALVSTDPASASSSWATTATGAAQLDSISCASTTLCVAGDNSGDVWYSVDPASGSWSEVPGLDTSAITALWCQSSGFCVAADESGNVLDSPDPSQGAGSWSAPAPSGTSSPILSLACVSAGGGGCVATSASATAGGATVAGPRVVGSSDWGEASGAPADLIQVACVSDQSCLGTDAMGDLVAGDVGPGVVTLSTGGLAFGKVGVGARSAEQTVTVTNSGPGALNIGGWTLAGADSTSFAVGSDNCSGASLGSGASCNLTVALSPAATGGLAASLQITSDDPAGPASVALTGTGAAASPAAVPTKTPPTVRSRTTGPSNAGHARFTRAAVTATLVDVIVVCNGSSGQRCTTHLRLTAHERLRGHQLLSVGDARSRARAVKVTVRAITLATGGATLAARRGRVVHLELNAGGRRLLRRVGKLHATLTATQAVDGKTVSTRRFHLSFTTRRPR